MATIDTADDGALHLENPFEEKLNDGEGDINFNSRPTRTKKEQQQRPSSIRTDSGNVDDTEERRQEADEVFEDELNYGPTEETGSNESVAGTDAEMKEDEEHDDAIYDSAQRIKAMLMAGEERAAHINNQGNEEPESGRHHHLYIDEEEVQDALIQAAEDAMRYAYEESTRRHADDTHISSFEQHQLSEVLVRQKQTLFKLDDVDHRVESMEGQLSKIVSYLQSGIESATPRTSSLGRRSSSPLSRQESGSEIVRINGSQGNEGNERNPATSLERPGEIESTVPPSVAMMLSQGYTEDGYPRYPYAQFSTNPVLLRIMRAYNFLRDQLQRGIQKSNQFLLNRSESDSWVDARAKMKSALNEVAMIVKLRLQRIRLYMEGRLSELHTNESEIRQIFDGMEERIVSGFILTTLASLLLIYRYRSRRRILTAPGLLQQPVNSCRELDPITFFMIT